MPRERAKVPGQGARKTHGRVQPSCKAAPLQLAHVAADEEVLSFARAWFHRANTQSLSLSLRGGFNTLPLRMQIFVSDLASQLRRLELRADHLNHLPLHEPAFPVLEYITVYTTVDAGEDLAPLAAPRIHDICLRGNVMLSETGKYPLLTRMEFTRTLYDPHSDWILPELLSTITLPRLRRLALPGLSTPAVLREFLACSACALDYLRLVVHDWCIETMAADLGGCIIPLPALQSLDVSVGLRSARLRAVLECLSVHDVLPALSALAISGCFTRHVDFPRLIAVLDARAPVLASFHLGPRDDPTGAGSSRTGSSRLSTPRASRLQLRGVTRLGLRGTRDTP
ncbi:hypothetical protein B0H17DRAFT_1129171 [Mycena rosella]|uniref:F-box domain-containing protein n=1 Tax=Mycena rosella TaxID=1033263 RepID=A0AAD7DUW8_MYCRO|nr:hypothetical protein B0H17DRAFT_1129171 [Mycena rosella]